MVRVSIRSYRPLVPGTHAEIEIVAALDARWKNSVGYSFVSPTAGAGGGAMIDTWSYPDYLDVRGTAGLVITGWSGGEGLFQPPDRSAAVPVATMYVSSNYFSTIGVTSAARTGLHAGRRRVARGSGGGDQPPHLAIAVRERPEHHRPHDHVNRTEYIIVGVHRKGSAGTSADSNEAGYQLWLPLSRHPRLDAAENTRFQRDANWVRIVARLTPGTTLRQADAAVQSAVAALAARYPATNHEKAGGVEAYFPPGPACGRK